MTRRQLPIFEDSIIDTISNAYYSQYYNASGASGASDLNTNSTTGTSSAASGSVASVASAGATGSVAGTMSSDSSSSRLDTFDTNVSYDRENTVLYANNCNFDTFTNDKFEFDHESSLESLYAMNSRKYSSSHKGEFGEDSSTLYNTYDCHKYRKSRQRKYQYHYHTSSNIDDLDDNNLSDSKKKKKSLNTNNISSSSNSSHHGSSSSRRSHRGHSRSKYQLISQNGTNSTQNKNKLKSAKSDKSGSKKESNAINGIGSNGAERRELEEKCFDVKYDEDYCSQPVSDAFGPSMSHSQFQAFDAKVRQEKDDIGTKLKPPKHSNMSFLLLKILHKFNHQPGQVIGNGSYGDNDSQQCSAPFMRGLTDSKHGVDCDCPKCTKHLRSGSCTSPPVGFGNNSSFLPSGSSNDSSPSKPIGSHFQAFETGSNGSNASSSNTSVVGSVDSKEQARLISSTNPVSIVTKLKQYYKWDIEFEFDETSQRRARGGEKQWRAVWTWNQSVGTRYKSWIGTKINGTDRGKKDAKKQCAEHIIQFLKCQAGDFANQIEMLKMGLKIGSIGSGSAAVSAAGGGHQMEPDGTHSYDELAKHSIHCNFFEIEPYTGQVQQMSRISNWSGMDDNYYYEAYEMHHGGKVVYTVEAVARSETVSLQRWGGRRLLNEKGFKKYYSRNYQISEYLEPNVKMCFDHTRQEMDQKRKIPYPCHKFLDDKGNFGKEFESKDQDFWDRIWKAYDTRRYARKASIKDKQDAAESKDARDGSSRRRNRKERKERNDKKDNRDKKSESSDDSDYLEERDNIDNSDYSRDMGRSCMSGINDVNEMEHEMKLVSNDDNDAVNGQLQGDRRKRRRRRRRDGKDTKHAKDSKDAKDAEFGGGADCSNVSNDSKIDSEVYCCYRCFAQSTLSGLKVVDAFDTRGKVIKEYYCLQCWKTMTRNDKSGRQEKVLKQRKGNSDDLDEMECEANERNMVRNECYQASERNNYKMEYYSNELNLDGKGRKMKRNNVNDTQRSECSSFHEMDQFDIENGGYYK